MYRIYFPMLFNGGVFWFFPDNPIETDLTGSTYSDHPVRNG
jgi:hypothetical protein